MLYKKAKFEMKTENHNNSFCVESDILQEFNDIFVDAEVFEVYFVDAHNTDFT